MQKMIVDQPRAEPVRQNATDRELADARPFR
jgi:hypothetical protein